MNSDSQALVLENITKDFSAVRAVDGLNWNLKKGRIYGLLGQNGAGKTTTLRMILSIIFPDNGSIRIFGEPLTEKHQNYFGYLPEERGLYRKMRVRDLLMFFGKIRGLSSREAAAKSSHWLERLELSGKANGRIDELSRGMQQKIQFIISVIHDPLFLILDEPFQGLDPVNADIFKNIILEQKQKGVTVILSTHIMEHAEKICDNICLIHKGAVKLTGSLADVRRTEGRNTVRFFYEGSGDYFHSLPDVVGYNDSGGSIEMELKEDADPSALLAQAVQHVRITGFEIKAPSLHQIFVRYVSENAGTGEERH